MTSEPIIRSLCAEEAFAQAAILAAILIACVAGGASVSFMAPLAKERAQGFWQQVAQDVASGARALLVAEIDGTVVGTVHLVLAQPENQPHRADVSKLLVHPQARRRGIADRLMQAAEVAALAAGKTLLVLDTSSGEAERLYTRLGWTPIGEIPGYALWPHGGECATRIFYKRLG
jgi:ribosomal protein S18 acetylase RimI-like enzyme